VYDSRLKRKIKKKIVRPKCPIYMHILTQMWCISHQNCPICPFCDL